MPTARRVGRYLFVDGAGDHLIARWLFLRALGLIYFSAFYALLFQVRGLVGPDGILPAGQYLQAVRTLGRLRFWYAPTLYWIAASDHALLMVTWIGLVAAVLLVLNIWPRAMLLACFVCFLSFIAAARDFASYQSDGMLLEAGFLSLFLAPGGLFPRWGARRPPIRAAILLLLWEWFRIYFQSGVVKLESGDPTWRNLTAMYEYYQNGPLPTWIGWYLQHLPHWFHIASAGLTLVMELVLVWIALLPGRWRVACFFLLTIWQAVVIATANYAFLNYLVLVLAILLLSDRYLRRFVPERWRRNLPAHSPDTHPELDADILPAADAAPGRDAARPSAPAFAFLDDQRGNGRVLTPLGYLRAGISAFVLTWIFYATCVPMVQMFWRGAPLPPEPAEALDPLRIANQYGLFAVMTPHRYEIEFQGSNDGQHWTAYPFRYKPQAPGERPRIYAPYQPRFDWNLWFASLGSWQSSTSLCPAPKSCCSKTTLPYSLSSPATRSRPPRPGWCARCSGSTGSAPRPRNAPKVSGGGGSCSVLTRPPSPACPTASSPSSRPLPSTAHPHLRPPPPCNPAPLASLSAAPRHKRPSPTIKRRSRPARDVKFRV
jgi:hypothetical protein